MVAHGRKGLGVAALAAAVLVIACQPQTDYAASMQPTVDALVDAWNTGNVDQLDGVVAADFRRRAPGAEMVEGIDGFKEVIRNFRTAYPDLRLVLDDAYYQENMAFVRWTFTGTNTGAGDMPPTGKAVENSGFTALHFEDGMYTFEDVYFDQLSWMEQLGYTVVPPTTM